MIALLFRVLFVALILGAIYYIMKMLLKPADYISCSRCEGRVSGMMPAVKRSAIGAKGLEDFPIYANFLLVRV